jgi:hypothetical protein
MLRSPQSKILMADAVHRGLVGIPGCAVMVRMMIAMAMVGDEIVVPMSITMVVGLAMVPVCGDAGRPDAMMIFEMRARDAAVKRGSVNRIGNRVRPHAPEFGAPGGKRCDETEPGQKNDSCEPHIPSNNAR